LLALAQYRRRNSSAIPVTPTVSFQSTPTCRVAEEPFSLPFKMGLKWERGLWQWCCNSQFIVYDICRCL